MSRGFDAVNDINDSKELWKLAVRVEDLWTVTHRGKEHLEFLILDKQGDQIQVILPSELCPLWKSTLVEGATYVMKNFKTQPNDFNLKYCIHPFKLVFVGGDGGTTIKPQLIPEIPDYNLNFKPFDEILEGKYHAEVLVDIIGAVHEIKPPKQTMAAKKWPTSFSLKDAAMNILPCALWGDLGQQFMNHYNSKTDDGPMVVIIKHAQIREPKGLFDLTISNAWTGTKLLLNPELQEIQEFIISLPENFKSPTQAGFLTVTTSVGQSSQNSQASQYSIPTRYCYNAPPKHLSELMSCAEDEIVTTVGTPHHVLTAKHGWYLRCCDHCSKSIITKVPPYTCIDPKHVTPEPKLKYKVEVEVRYQDQKIRTVLWDRECEELIGQSAAEVKDVMVQEGEFDPTDYLIALDKLVGTEFALKVKAQPTFKMVSLLNYKTDPDIIQHIKDQIPNLETTSKLTINEQASQQDSQPLTASAAETEFEVLKYDTQDLSNTGDSDLTPVLNTKVGKRTVAESSPDEAKFSTNKITKNIKQEGRPKRK
ncbi:hypothetical protein QL285_069055 [Trifolium repens]|nr:hypothetical protein QL285_069055 [Trifolium repens]